MAKKWYRFPDKFPTANSAVYLRRCPEGDPFAATTSASPVWFIVPSLPGLWVTWWEFDSWRYQ